MSATEWQAMSETTVVASNDLRKESAIIYVWTSILNDAISAGVLGAKCALVCRTQHVVPFDNVNAKHE